MGKKKGGGVFTIVNTAKASPSIQPRLSVGVSDPDHDGNSWRFTLSTDQLRRAGVPNSKNPALAGGKSVALDSFDARAD